MADTFLMPSSLVLTKYATKTAYLAQKEIKKKYIINECNIPVSDRIHLQKQDVSINRILETLF